MMNIHEELQQLPVLGVPRKVGFIANDLSEAETEISSLTEEQIREAMDNTRDPDKLLSLFVAYGRLRRGSNNLS